MEKTLNKKIIGKNGEDALCPRNASPDLSHIDNAIIELKKAIPKLKTERYITRTALRFILEDINPVLAKNGCCLIHPLNSTTELTYVTTLISHTSGQYIRLVTRLQCLDKIRPSISELDIQYVRKDHIKSLLGLLYVRKDHINSLKNK